MGNCSTKKSYKQPSGCKTSNASPTQEPHEIHQHCDLSLIDSDCAFIKKFNIEENTITYIGENWYTHLLGSVPIRQNNTFSLKIMSTARRDLSVGVVDGSQKVQRITYSRYPSLIYYSGDGKVHGDGQGVIKQEGKGFYEGDIVKVIVHQPSATISWEVNGIIQATYSMQSLKDPQVNWVPYLIMFHSGDQVRLLE